MKHLLITIGAMLCLLPACGYSPCDCDEYQKLEEFSKTLDHSKMSSEYAALLQESTDLNVTLSNRKSQLAKIPSVKTKIRQFVKEGKKGEFIDVNSGPDVDLIRQKLESLQPQLEASCADRGFATIEFDVDKGRNVRSFHDIDGTLTGSKVECIHDVLHNTSFDISSPSLVVRHTFFIRDPQGVRPKIEPPTQVPEPLAIKSALEKFQKHLIGKCGISKPGGLKLEFKVDSTGKPYDIKVVQDALKDDEAKTCIIQRLGYAELPPFPENKQPVISYEFRN